MKTREYDEIEEMESQGVSFDFKGFLFKVLNLWKLVLLCLGVALLVAYFINVRKESIYRLDSLITINNEVKMYFVGYLPGVPVLFADTIDLTTYEWIRISPKEVKKRPYKRLKKKLKKIIMTRI